MLRTRCGQGWDPRETSPMTIIASRLSVLAAYAAFAFVGAIVLGLF